ncbi:MAG TPA: 23S rRNA (adenine(2030)-N(6))-methyltransferase RlmJ [Steroidobacteraceae bacterium]|nr:23S rRNA (adenine(2030)-N(6))-methyltransferase RlmJ [Steroidobacteraceae bacterium]
MKYRHQFHAGNFADVHKHVLLLDVLTALTRKDKGLLFVDTHAGRGEYQLHPGDAAHPAEWQSGAAKLLVASPAHEALRRYRQLLLARQHGASLFYHGSPLLAAGTLRAVDRMAFFETQRDEAGQLRKSLAAGDAGRNVRVETTDGFAGLRALLPPPERRGCVLIDPPYEEREDHARVSAAIEDCLQRFESAVLLLWLPVKLRADFDAWRDKLLARVTRPVLASLLWMHPCDSRAALNGSAMVVVNPPYLVEQEMREWLPELRALLGGARSGCEVIASAPR